MKILLQGGIRDGEELDIPGHLTVLEVPKMTPRHGIDETEHKRHSWDDGALTIETEFYRRTDRLVNDAVVFEP